MEVIRPVSPGAPSGCEELTWVCNANEKAAFALMSGVGGANPGKGNNVTTDSEQNVSIQQFMCTIVITNQIELPKS
jgi:hypothetical protein